VIIRSVVEVLKEKAFEGMRLRELAARARATGMEK